MKTLGCTVGIIGAVLCIASFGLFGREILRAVNAHVVTTVPLELSNKIRTPTIKVDIAKLCSISVRATVRSNYSQRETGQQDKYDLKYAFPFQYSVYDSMGKVLVSEKEPFGWNSGTQGSTSNSEVTEHGGSATVKRDYRKFKVPAPGEIQIEAQIASDTIYRAEANDLTLVVYDNVTEHSKSVGVGCVMLSLGGLTALGGLMVFLIGVSRKPKTAVTTG